MNLAIYFDDRAHWSHCIGGGFYEASFFPFRKLFLNTLDATWQRKHKLNTGSNSHHKTLQQLKNRLAINLIE